MDSNARIRDFRRALRALEREIELDLQSQTDCCGVSLAQCHLILELKEQPDSTVSDLAQSLGLDKSTLSRGMESLRKHGWAETVRDETDRRNLKAALTREGRTKADEIDHICDARYAALLGRLSKDDEDAVVRGTDLLALILRNDRLARVAAPVRCCVPSPAKAVR
jgi:DNA-binding MarR family transcriptional regulator